MNMVKVCLRGILICLAVLAAMTGAGTYLLAVDYEAPPGRLDSQALFQQTSGEEARELENPEEDLTADAEQNGQAAGEEDKETAAAAGEDESGPAVESDPVLASPKDGEEQIAEEAEPEKEAAEEVGTEEPEEEKTAGKKTNSSLTGGPEEQAENPTERVEAEEQAESQPDSGQNAAVAEERQEPVQPSPVSYSWGASRSYTFRIEVRLTNSGSNTSQNVRVSVPLLENSSPYQTTTLKSLNYSPVSSSGRVSTFNIGDIPPGQSRSIIADYNITVRTVSLNSSNETVEKARTAYEQYAGDGNCRTLARGFINKCRQMGVTAREVVGFARPHHGPMTSGSLQGTRHSWAEFYVDGLGWVPVDLTFRYFGSLPHTSHIVEAYGDQSIRVNFSGGRLSATWNNSVQ